jgi:hypothetical protein
VFPARRIHADGTDHLVASEVLAVKVDDRQVHLLEVPLAESLERLRTRLLELPTHRRARHPAAPRHLGHHLLVVARAHPPHQSRPHLLAQALIALHRRIGRDRHLRSLPSASPAQPRLLHPHPLAPQRHHPSLGTVATDHPARLARMRRSRHLLRRKRQHRLQDGLAQLPHQFVYRLLARSDQLHHLGQRGPVLGQVLAHFLSFRLTHNLIHSLHGGSLLYKVWLPDSTR